MREGRLRGRIGESEEREPVTAVTGEPTTSSVGARKADEEPNEEDRAFPYTGNFVGEVPGTEAFVAVVVDKENHALAYTCATARG